MTEEIKSKRKQFIALVPETSDMTIIVLKGHLIIEELLNEILKTNCEDYKSMVKANLTFYQKACVAKALMDSIGSVYFSSIFLLNRLRNDLAHNIDTKKRASLIESFISKSTSLFCETYNENSSIEGKLRNAVCHAINSLSLSANLSIIWKKG